MEPTLQVGARVTAVKAPPVLEAVAVAEMPQNGTMHECGADGAIAKPGGRACDSRPTAKEGLIVVDRVVAGPGDQIYEKSGHVYRKPHGSRGPFVREHDPYIRPCKGQPECDFPNPITIPSGEWFLMGDNRGEADDSRQWGPVPASWIVGLVTTVTERVS